MKIKMLSTIEPTLLRAILVTMVPARAEMRRWRGVMREGDERMRGAMERTEVGALTGIFLASPISAWSSIFVFVVLLAWD